MNTQEKFTAALHALAKRKRCDLIEDSRLSNTGTFRFQRFSEFEDLLRVRYSFQPDYVTLHIEKQINTIEFPHAAGWQLQDALDAINDNLEEQHYED